MTDKRAIEVALASFFEQLAHKDLALLKIIRQESCFHIDQSRWLFTLPDLYSFLLIHDDIFSSVNYNQFRQLLFSSAINQDIKPYGAEIVITDNQGNVDRSAYALVWHEG